MNYDGFEAIFAGLLAFLVIIGIICIIAVVIRIVARWIFFKKCGEEGWKALIPFYNEYVLIKIAGLNWWWILILYIGTLTAFSTSLTQVMQEAGVISLSYVISLLSGLNFIFSMISLVARVNVNYNLSKKFNKEASYCVLLTLFETIMLLILGLSKEEKYDANKEVTLNGFFDKKVSENSNSNVLYCSNCGTKVEDEFCPNCGTKMR